MVRARRRNDDTFSRPFFAFHLSPLDRGTRLAKSFHSQLFAPSTSFSSSHFLLLPSASGHKVELACDAMQARARNLQSLYWWRPAILAFNSDLRTAVGVHLWSRSQTHRPVQEDPTDLAGQQIAGAIHVN